MGASVTTGGNWHVVRGTVQDVVDELNAQGVGPEQVRAATFDDLDYVVLVYRRLR